MPENQREIPEIYKKHLHDKMGYYRWMSKKSQKEYYAMSIIVIISNTVVAVLANSIESDSPIKYVITAFGMIAAILSGILMLRQSKETWIKCHITHRKLMSEKILFETGSGIYSNGTAEDFILTCEKIMMDEHETWERIRRNNQNKENR